MPCYYRINISWTSTKGTWLAELLAIVPQMNNTVHTEACSAIIGAFRYNLAIRIILGTVRHGSWRNKYRVGKFVIVLRKSGQWSVSGLRRNLKTVWFMYRTSGLKLMIDSKGILGQHRNELWNTDKKNESCGMILWKKARNKETGLEVGLR